MWLLYSWSRIAISFAQIQSVNRSPDSTCASLLRGVRSDLAFFGAPVVSLLAQARVGVMHTSSNDDDERVAAGGSKNHGNNSLTGIMMAPSLGMMSSLSSISENLPLAVIPVFAHESAKAPEPAEETIEGSGWHGSAQESNHERSDRSHVSHESGSLVGSSETSNETSGRLGSKGSTGVSSLTDADTSYYHAYTTTAVVAVDGVAEGGDGDGTQAGAQEGGGGGGGVAGAGGGGQGGSRAAAGVEGEGMGEGGGTSPAPLVRGGGGSGDLVADAFKRIGTAGLGVAASAPVVTQAAMPWAIPLGVNAWQGPGSGVVPSNSKALAEMLVKGHLLKFEGKLREHGVNELADVEKLSTDDLISKIGMNKIEIARLKRHSSATMEATPLATALPRATVCESSLAAEGPVEARAPSGGDATEGTSFSGGEPDGDAGLAAALFSAHRILQEHQAHSRQAHLGREQRLGR